MRHTSFGDLIVENFHDDLGAAFAEIEPEECYAIIHNGSDGFYFEVMDIVCGDPVASSDPIFATAEEAQRYLHSWLPANAIEGV